MNSSTHTEQSPAAIIVSANALLAKARVACDEGQALFERAGIDPSRVADVVAHARVHGLHAPLHELIAARVVPQTQAQARADVPEIPIAVPLPGRGAIVGRATRRRTPMV